MGKILSIDYGQKRIGLAISDENEIIAQAFGDILVKDEQTAIKDLANLINKESVETVLFGIPLGYDGKPTQMSLEINNFAELLSTNINVKIKYLNETMTSELAKQNIRNFKLNHSIDSEAARIILQEYLNHKAS